MHRNANVYTHLDADLLLTIFKTDGTTTEAIIEKCFEFKIKLYHWSDKGKNGIVSEHGVSLAAMLADEYGYRPRNWRRVDTNSTSYLKDNFANRLAASGSAVKNWVSIRDKIKAQHIPTARVQEFFPHKKWKNKHEIVTLVVQIVHGSTVLQSINIQINAYLQQFMPKKVTINGDNLTLFSGCRLDHHILRSVGSVPDDAKRPEFGLTSRSSFYDYRIDPSSGAFVSTAKTHYRYHSIVVDGSRCVVVERFECADAIAAHPTWGWLPEKFIQPRVPTDGPWRISYVMLDADLAPKLRAMNEVDDELCPFYAADDGEWYIYAKKLNNIGECDVKRHQLKRAVLEVSGVQTTNQYFPPRMTRLYAKALAAAEASDGYGRADQVRAKYENATGESRYKMFTEPKTIRRRIVVADREYFCTQIYGGVGIWVKDLRASSIRMKTNATLTQVVNTDSTTKQST